MTWSGFGGNESGDTVIVHDLSGTGVVNLTPDFTDPLDGTGPNNSGDTLAVIGDSHAHMWMPTVLRLAQSDGWVVVPFVKLGCVARLWSRPHSGCQAWYRWAKRHAKALRPDVALIAGRWAATESSRSCSG